MDKCITLLLPLFFLLLGGGCAEESSSENSAQTEESLRLPLFHGAQPLPEADSFMVDVGDTRLFVTTMGSGPAVLIIHGGPGMSHHYLRPFLDYLSRGFRLIYYDQRLSGQSDPECDTSLVTLNQWVEDIEAIRESVGVEHMSLITHSWGTRVGLRYAAIYPDQVRNIVFLNPVGLNPVHVQTAVSTLQSRITAQDQLARQKATSSESYQRGDRDAYLAAYRLSFAQQIYQKDILDSIRLYIPDRAPVRQQSLARLYRDPALQLYNDYSFLDRIQAPSLVVRGAYEANPQAAIDEMMLHLSNSRQLEIPGCGHFSFLEKPLALALELEPFLLKNQAM